MRTGGEPDWRNEADYDFTSALTGGQWAWEFLRRNPAYRVEWEAFRATWQALEEQYGRPPNRDFCAWKLDSRAWVPASDAAAGDCRIDDDKVLIECAFGARWGFHKFPPDPADDDPVGGNRLVWREYDERLEPLGPGDGSWLGSYAAKVALGFDLRRPLVEQLDRAKRLLQIERRRRERSGDIERLTVANFWRRWRLQLRLLDAKAAGAGVEEMGAELAIDDAGALLAEARTLCERGYRELARLP